MASFVHKSALCMVLIMAGFLLSACSAKQPDRQLSQVGVSEPGLSAAEAEKRVRFAYHDWRGTRHRLGGTSRAGIDCSALVQVVYRDQFGVSVPRTTQALSSSGRQIGRGDMRAGDLVFFKPDTYPKHVGIYLSRGEFLHVSAKRGVIISKIDSQYWSKHFWTARRILR